MLSTVACTHLWCAAVETATGWFVLIVGGVDWSSSMLWTVYGDASQCRKTKVSRLSPPMGQDLYNWLQHLSESSVTICFQCEPLTESLSAWKTEFRSRM